jgi:AcrR family transcriptional regulator
MPRPVNKNVKRNPEKTRRKLLESGVKLFSDRGYDGVAVDEIVNLAECNKRMLYYYFGNKEGLYVEVLRVVFAELEQMEVQALGGGVSTGDAIRRILSSYFDFLERHPEFVSLLMWENLHRGRFLEAHPQLLSKSPVIDRLQEVIERAREQGEIDCTVDARHLLVLLYGTCFLYHSNRYTLRHTMGLDCSNPAVLREGLALAQSILVEGLVCGK